HREVPAVGPVRVPAPGTLDPDRLPRRRRLGPQDPPPPLQRRRDPVDPGPDRRRRPLPLEDDRPREPRDPTPGPQRGEHLGQPPPRVRLPRRRGRPRTRRDPRGPRLLAALSALPL